MPFNVLGFLLDEETELIGDDQRGELDHENTRFSDSPVLGKKRAMHLRAFDDS